MDKIKITVNGVDYVGWFKANIERSLETIAARFSLECNSISAIKINRQDEVIISVNDEQIISGIVLAAEQYYTGHDDYGLRMNGYDRTGDLVTGAAEHNKTQWLGATILQIAVALCEPYKIKVVVDDEVDISVALLKFELEAGESVAEALARLVKYRGVIVTRNNSGDVVLTTAGKLSAPADLVLGKNIISMEALGTDADRCSHYKVSAERNLETNTEITAIAVDKYITRYKPCRIIADAGSTQADVQTLAEHTLRIRTARAYSYKYTVAGWTANERTWQPNELVNIRDSVRGEDTQMLIVSANITVSRKDGDITELVVAPASGYAQSGLPPKQKKMNKDWGNKDNKLGLT